MGFYEGVNVACLCHPACFSIVQMPLNAHAGQQWYSKPRFVPVPLKMDPVCFAETIAMCSMGMPGRLP